MDKETLSNYGWIVICVLVLAVMIALATPFGSYISSAVKSTTSGLLETNRNALNSTGLINIDNQTFDTDDNNQQNPTEPTTPSEPSQTGFILNVTISQFNVDKAKSLKIYDGTDNTGTVIFERSDFTSEDNIVLNNANFKSGHIYIEATANRSSCLVMCILLDNSCVDSQLMPYQIPCSFNITQNGNLKLKVDFDF